MKKLIALALTLSLALTVSLLTACGSSTSSAASASSAAAASGSASSSVDMPEITEGSCEAPIVVTSIGQSADVDIVDTLCSKAGLTVYTKATLSADELTDQYKTLILAVGGSSKGLGAAGIDADQELTRTNDLLAKAKDLGITIVATHTGGSARRGTLSDKFITPAFTAANLAIVVSEGDSDDMMANILSANNTPSAYVDQATDVIPVLKTMFGA